MHDEIKRFSLDGEISESNLVAAKERLVTFLESQMRDSGCVPALDLEPQFTLDYDAEREVHNFILSVYGIHVGRERACQASSSAEQAIAGIMAGKTITRSTPPAR